MLLSLHFLLQLTPLLRQFIDSSLPINSSKVDIVVFQLVEANLPRQLEALQALVESLSDRSKPPKLTTRSGQSFFHASGCRTQLPPFRHHGHAKGRHGWCRISNAAAPHPSGVPSSSSRELEQPSQAHPRTHHISY